MAHFPTCGDRSSSSARFYVFALVGLVLICSFSSCTSSASYSLDSPLIGMNDSPDSLDMDNDSIDLDERAIPARSPLLGLLLRSAILQSRGNSDRQPHRHRPNQVHFNNRRYAPQSFHAMRG